MVSRTETIKELRELTGAGVMACKSALDEAGQDLKKAKEILQKKGIAIAQKKASRPTGEGRIEAYIHHDGKTGVLIEVACETDFVAKNVEFIRFCKDMAMQIAAKGPNYIRREEASADSAKDEILLEQPFIKDEGVTIGEYLTSLIAKVGENIVIRRFARFDVSN